MVEITPRERFQTAFLHQEADRVPVFEVPNNPELFRRQLGESNEYSEGIPHVRLSKALGMDACFVPEGGYTGIIRPYWEWIKLVRRPEEPVHYLHHGHRRYPTTFLYEFSLLLCLPLRLPIIRGKYGAFGGIVPLECV